MDVFKDDTLEAISNRTFESQIELNRFVLKGIEEQILSFSKIDRPKKNKRLSIEEKKKIITHFDSWKKKFSIDL